MKIVNKLEGLMADLRERLLKENLIKTNDKILIGVSGGKDSVVLLDILLGLKDKLKLTLELAHINHLLRGEEADLDEELVRKLSEENRIVFHLHRQNMNDFAISNKLSKEEAGRKIRHDFFRGILDKKEDGHLWKIALAHNSNDQAETIIMRLMRGTGLDGLEGIRPVNGNIIRPLLTTSRSEIDTYVEEKKLRYRQDMSNFSNDYSRNKIRNVLLPYMRDEFNPQIERSLIKLSDMVVKYNNFIDSSIEDIISEILLLRNNRETIFLRKKFEELDNFKKVLILRKEIKRLNDNLNSFEATHFDEFIKILDSRQSKRVNINGIISYTNFDKFIISKARRNDLLGDIEVKDFVDQDFSINGFKIKLIFSRERPENGFYYPISENSKVKIRKRMNGDRIFYKNKYRKLKDYLIDKRVDQYLRDFLPILIVDEEIILVGNYYIYQEVFEASIYMKVEVSYD